MLPQITVGPDGCTLDAEGHIWAADEAGGRCIRVAPGGAIVDPIGMPDARGGCFAGAAGRRTRRDGALRARARAPDYPVGPADTPPAPDAVNPAQNHRRHVRPRRASKTLQRPHCLERPGPPPDGPLIAGIPRRPAAVLPPSHGRKGSPGIRIRRARPSGRVPAARASATPPPAARAVRAPDISGRMSLPKRIRSRQAATPASTSSTSACGMPNVSATGA